MEWVLGIEIGKGHRALKTPCFPNYSQKKEILTIFFDFLGKNFHLIKTSPNCRVYSESLPSDST